VAVRRPGRSRTLCRFCASPSNNGLSRLAVGRPVIKWEVYPSPASPVPWAPLANISLEAAAMAPINHELSLAVNTAHADFLSGTIFSFAMLDDRAHVVGPQHERGDYLAFIGRAIVNARTPRSNSSHRNPPISSRRAPVSIRSLMIRPKSSSPQAFQIARTSAASSTLSRDRPVCGTTAARPACGAPLPSARYLGRSSANGRSRAPERRQPHAHRSHDYRPRRHRSCGLSGD
jgi:hypothetical protein